MRDLDGAVRHVVADPPADAYLTWDPRPGRVDAERSCVSNVRPPHGLGYEQATGTLAALLAGARELGASGVALKDDTALPG